MAISVYLSRKNADIVIGKSVGTGAKINSIYREALPEGSMINGLITDEYALSEFLSGLWKKYSLPKRPVMLTLDSTSFVCKRIEIPVTVSFGKKKLMNRIRGEFNNVMANEDLLCDYMTLSSNRASEKKSFKKTLLAVSAESEFIGSCASLFEKSGLAIESIRPALACGITLLSKLKCMKNGGSVALIYDGSVCASYLMIDGMYVYSGNTRIINLEGTEGFNTEIMRAISVMLQFHASEKLDTPLKNVYFAGFSEQYSESLLADANSRYGSSDITAAELGDDELIKLPDESHFFGESKSAAKLKDHIYAIGNLSK